MNRFVHVIRQVHRSPVVAVAILALVGALVLASAPQPTPPITQAKMGIVGSAATATPQPTATSQPTTQPTPIPPTPTYTPAPQPTDTPIPPTPVPPTPTPAPSWHDVATYSGNTAETLPSFTTSDPWQIVWSCTLDTSGATGFGFDFSNEVEDFHSFARHCSDANDTSGTDSVCYPAAVYTNSPCYGAHTFTIKSIPCQVQGVGTLPMDSWTVTIQEWY